MSLMADEEEWTVTYMRYGTAHTLDFCTLEGAVGFACDGEETWQYAANKIVGPGGVVLEGETLSQAKSRFAVPEMYGDLNEFVRSLA